MPTHEEGERAMTAVDDIEVGMWLTITRFEPASDDDFRPSYDGLPLKVLAKSLPFIAVEDRCGLVDTVDVRVHEFQKLDQDYVNVIIAATKRGGMVAEFDPPRAVEVHPPEGEVGADVDEDDDESVV